MLATQEEKMLTIQKEKRLTIQKEEMDQKIGQDSPDSQCLENPCEPAVGRKCRRDS